MTSDNSSSRSVHNPESASDNGEAAEGRRHGAKPTVLTAAMGEVHATYVEGLRSAPVDDDTRRAYASRVRQYLAWLSGAAAEGDPLADPVARNWAVRDYRVRGPFMIGHR